MTLTAEQLDRYCSAAYVDGLEEAPVSELRRRRDDCSQAEMLLSYLRRVVQGEIDLVVAEIDLRADTGHSDVSRLVAELPSILVPGPPPEPAEHTSVPAMELTPMTDLEGAASPEELLAAVLGSDELEPVPPKELLPGANVCAFSDDELRAVLGRLRDQETVLSTRRRSLHERIDDLQALIVDRYKTGAADPDSLLA
jgi:hypothetical protein